MKRYFVQRSDDGATLGDGRDHTWDVIDRVTGYCVCNVDRRRDARMEANKRNSEVQ